MSSRMSVDELLSHLEQRAVLLREQEGVHARQEAHHREQRALFAAELEKVTLSLAALREVTAAAKGLVQPLGGRPASAERLPPPDRLMVSRLLKLVVEGPGLQEPFNPDSLAAEANRRFADRLKRPIGSRTASDALRRLLAEGEVRLVRQGKGSRQALYARL